MTHNEANVVYLGPISFPSFVIDLNLADVTRSSTSTDRSAFAEPSAKAMTGGGARNTFATLFIWTDSR